MSAPVLQSGETRATFSGTSATVNKPAGVAAGDLLLVVLFLNNSTNWTTPSGWTAGPIASPAVSPLFRSFYRVADGSEGASFTFSIPGGLTNSGDITCQRITGAHPTSPVDATSTASVNFNGANPITLPSVTTLGADRLLVAVFGAQSTGSTLTFSTPTGMTAGYVYTVRPVPNTQQYAFTETIAASGATGTRDSNINATNVARVAAMFAIAPPAAPSTGQLWPHGKKGTPPTTGQTFPRGVIL